MLWARPSARPFFRIILFQVAIVVPTFKEADNVDLLHRKLCAALAGVDFEVIFVDDDSLDGTDDRVRALARRVDNVRCIHRIGRRGLASACIEGALSSSADFIAVMDGDLQHDETLIPAMAAELRTGSVDVVIGSRYVAGGSVGGWSADRAAASRIANALAARVTRTNVKDLVSGFFMTRASLWRELAPQLTPVGFKILVDLLASSPTPLRTKELPYVFRNRGHGESKLDSGVALDFLLLLWEKRFGRWVSSRFLLFAAVGSVGVAVHLLLLVSIMAAGVGFVAAQSMATLGAITSNFLLNNAFTCRDKRLSGPRALVIGWLTFTGAGLLSAIANVGVAALIHAREFGGITSALAGILVGTAWNYMASKTVTWRA